MVYPSQATGHTTESMEGRSGCSTRDLPEGPCSRSRRNAAAALSSDHSKNSGNDGEKGSEELIVWPWMAVIANFPTKSTVNEAKRCITRLLATPVKFHHLGRCDRDTRFTANREYLVLEFNGDWGGFADAMKFEKVFVRDDHGRSDWYLPESEKGEKIYAWIARYEDYDSRGIIGDHLRGNGELKTIAEVAKDEKWRFRRKEHRLNDTLDSKNKECEDIEVKINYVENSIQKAEMAKEEIIGYINEVAQVIEQMNKVGKLREVFHKPLERKLQLDAHEKKLKGRESEIEKMKLNNQLKMNARATFEQKKADEKALRLAEDLKRQKEELHRRVIELQKQLDAKQALELEIERMKGSLQVIAHMEEGDEEGDNENRRKMNETREELKEKEEELEQLEELSHALIVKERKTNDELQEARKELIKGLEDQTTLTEIGVKRMGDLNSTPFLVAAKKQYPAKLAAEKAAELCSLWAACLGDPSWHPFKVVPVEGSQALKEIIDEGDEKLRTLRKELGDEVYMAVTTALMEINEYNSSGHYIVKELWNHRADRKVTLLEGISHLLDIWKRKRRS